jgi:quinol monooxygenase YgiN
VAVSERGELALSPTRQPGDNRLMTDAPELYIFARFHARPGLESEVAEALLEVIGPTRQEPGCLGVHAFRSLRDPRLFYIHSRWRDEAAFELHAALPHTVRFLERVEPLIDGALDIARTRRIG